MTDIRNHSLKELEGILKKWQIPPYHARQIFSWIYRKGISSFEAMTNLSLALRKKLKGSLAFREIELAKLQESIDGTKKLLFRLEDGSFIESVLIPAEGRDTACLSSQAGCKYRCDFCASGLLGFKRNLAVWEILTQLLEINRMNRRGLGKVSHVVFMGIGEPLDNYNNVLKAIKIINCHSGLNIGARRITISTSGLIPAIERLSKEGMQIELSISLHASDDKARTQLMPINKKYPLKELISACKKYASVTGRQVTFEYVLIKGINCSNESAHNLVKLLTGWNAKVNLLIYNPVKELLYEPPSNNEVLDFRRLLKNAKIPVTIRKPRGKDISAACGQLRISHKT